MADNIVFNTIPASGLTAPIMSFEVNSGGQYDAPDRFILMGHKTAAGTLPFNTPTPVYDQATVDGYAGAGSMLREMFRIASANAPATPVWIVAVPENGVAPVWTWTVGTLPGIGVGSVVICGEEIDIPVTAADTPATIAAALASAVNGYYNSLTRAMLPVTATASGAVVTLTARHAAAVMNELDFFVPTLLASNLFAAAGVLSLAQVTVGAGVPTLAAALNALGDDPADFVVSPWSDTGSLAACTTAFGDVSGRWAWSRQSYGHAWTAAAASFAALTTLGLSLNDRHTSIIPRVPSVAAAGSIAFTANPAAGTTLTIGNGAGGGTTVSFVAAAPTGSQVLIGASLAATLASLLAFLQASTDVNLMKCGYALVSSTLQVTADALGTVGNGYGLATTVAGATLSGTTLAGGLDGCPEPSWLWVAGFSARVAPWLSDIDTGNVSRNQTGLVVQGLHPPRSPGLAPTYAGRNTLANSGLSTWRVGADGSVQVDKIVTTYRVGASGQPDAVFRDIQAMYQVAGGLKFLRALLAQEHGQKAIADANPGSLGAISTTSDIKATFVHGYGTLVRNGVFEDLDTYAKSITVARDGSGGSGNRARVNVYNPMQRVSPLDVLAANATIYQQFPQTAS